MPAPRVLLAVVLGAALAGGGLAGCADAPVAPGDPGRPGAPATAAPGSAGTADPAALDAAYARAMIPHHEQALELAALVPGRSASPEVADLAFRIDRDQVEEVGQLRGLLRLRGQDPAAGGTGPFAMSGMADGTTLAALRAATGPDFDRRWLTAMRAHHEGALDMARRHLALAGPGSALREFSRTLVPTQQAEIDRIDALLAA